ncbi:MAG: Ig-like domain-containing protein [Longimicrobiales bacterium]
MKSGTAFRLAIACGMIVAGAACDSGSEPLSPGDRLKANAPFLVSNSGHGVTAAAAGYASVSSAALIAPSAFISLPPGSIPNGTAASLRSPDGNNLSVAVVDGGFDPVRVAAGAGDTITIVITLSDGGSRVFKVSVPSKAPPKIVRTTPIPLKRDVVLNARLMVVFTEPLNGTALTPGRIKLQKGGTAVAGTLQFVDADHTTLEFVPAEPLAPSTDYEMVVSAAITDLDGSALESGETIGFTTQAPPRPLELINSNPGSGSVLVPAANPAIQLWFSEHIDRLSLFTGAGHPRVYLMRGTDTVPGGVVCEASTGTLCSSLRYVPSSLLSPATDYRLFVSSGLRSGDGGILMQSLTISFRTQDPPAVATRLFLLSGHQQVTMQGTFFPLPLVVKAIDAQDRPVAGVPVMFTPRAGTGQPTTVFTNAQGLASTTWFADLPGLQFMNVEAPGLAPALIPGQTPTCDLIPLEIGGIVSGAIPYPNPCLLPTFGQTGDAYRVTLAQQQIFTLSTTSEDMFFYLTDSNPWPDQSVFRFGISGVSQSTFVLPAGVYTLTAAVSEPYGTSAYTITTAAHTPESIGGCWPASTMKTIPGVTIAGSVDQTDCNAVTGRYDEFMVSLKAGASINVSATSSTATILAVHTAFTQPSTSPTLNFTAPADGAYTVRLYNPSPASIAITYSLAIRQ